MAKQASLAARALLTILTRLTTGLLFGGISKVISGSGTVGYGLFPHKHGKCYRVQKCKGAGVYLAPHPRFGLFMKHGNDISDGDGLLMAGKSPFKNIPIFGWLL